MKKIIILPFLVVFLYACDNNNNVNIFLPAFSTYPYVTINADANGCDTTLFARHDNWGFDSGLKLDSSSVPYPHCEKVFVDKEEPPKKVPGVCSDEVLTVKYDFVKNNERLEPVQITGSWFKFTKKSLLEANIVVDTNESGVNREVRIYSVDDRGTAIVVSQSAK